MANKFIQIASVTVGSGGSTSIEFTSIPQTYTDLVVKTSLRSNRAVSRQDNPVIRFNSSTSNYTIRRLYGDGSSVASATNTKIYLGNCPSGDATANTFGNIEIYIPNYTTSNNKSVSIDGVQEDNQTSAYAEIGAGLWSDASAITSVKLELDDTSRAFVQHSTATLYGIKKN
jgi:hypothetical protein